MVTKSLAKLGWIAPEVSAMRGTNVSSSGMMHCRYLESRVRVRVSQNQRDRREEKLKNQSGYAKSTPKKGDGCRHIKSAGWSCRRGSRRRSSAVVSGRQQSSALSDIVSVVRLCQTLSDIVRQNCQTKLSDIVRHCQTCRAPVPRGTFTGPGQRKWCPPGACQLSLRDPGLHWRAAGRLVQLRV